MKNEYNEYYTPQMRTRLADEIVGNIQKKRDLFAFTILKTKLSSLKLRILLLYFISFYI